MTREVGPERRDGPSGHAKGNLDSKEASALLGTLFWDSFSFSPISGTEFVCSHLSVPV